MNALVVFESFFGNTEVVARAIAEALELSAHTSARARDQGHPQADAEAAEPAVDQVRALRVAEWEPYHLEGVDLLVVGSATRKFRPSPGTQAWLAKLAPGQLAGVRVAAFDTRIDETKVGNAFVRFLMRRFGYAAEPIQKRLERAGGTVAGAPAGFIVEDSEGPLREGETDRARAWARTLIAG